MGSEWPYVTLGEVAQIKHGFAFKGEYFTDEVQPTLLVTPGNFTIGGGFQRGKPKYYAGPVPEDYVLSKDDLIVTMTDLSKASDTLGYAAKIPETPGVKYLHNQRIGLVQITDGNLVTKDWLHYLMRTDEYRSWVLGSATGTTVKHTSPKRIQGYSFRVPPLEEQKEVAFLLDSIESRIEALRQANATLEAIAQALFKSWFVDFDPVHAKAEGREPEGMDPVTAALFPSEFEDSELGPIPKGWRWVSFRDVATLVRGNVKPFDAPERAFRHYSLPAFDAGQVPLIELGEAIKSNKTPVPSNAVLVSKLNPRIPRVWFVSEPGDDAICSTEFLAWTAKEAFGIAFVYTLAASPAFNRAMQQLVTGTSSSHQRVRSGRLAEVRVAAIGGDTVAAFEAFTAPILQQIEHNRRRAAALAELRDTLLPRLISGRLLLLEAAAGVDSLTI